MPRNSLLALLVLGISLLAGCRGSDDHRGTAGGPQDPSGPPPTSVRGTLLQNPPALVATFSASDLTARNFDIAAINGQGESILLAALFAANGDIVVAPNYAGHSTSTLSYHPYLNAEQRSKDMIDALTAARVLDSGKLFITGNSQGGCVAMATHRALPAAGVPVAASAPISEAFPPVASASRI